MEYIYVFLHYLTGRRGRQDQLVKFSEDPDLLPDQCHTLLYKYMPEHIRSTKITQRLFVKYVITVCYNLKLYCHKLMCSFCAAHFYLKLRSIPISKVIPIQERS